MNFIRLFLFGLSTIFAVTNSAQYSNLAIANIEESLLENAHSVVRLDNMTISFEDGKVKYKIEYAITILDEKHKEHLTVGLPYQEGNSKMQDIDIKYLDAKGDVIKKVKSKEIEDRYLHGFELLSGSRFKYFGYETKAYPITKLISYTEVDKSTVFVKRWVAFGDFNMAVESTTLTIENPDNADFQVIADNLNEYNIEHRNDEFFSGSNLKAVTKEKYMPSLYLQIPTVRVYPSKMKYYDHETTATTWQGVGDWMYLQMFAPQQNCKVQELKIELDRVVGDETDQMKIAKRLYRYMQDETRYVAIMLEDGGYVPLETEVVHTKKYGDCKALSYYYHTLLKLYDIKSDLAFVYAGDMPATFDENLVTPTRFNHVINQVWIDGKDHWVDCTSSHKPFGFIGSFSDDRQTLIANAEGSRLAKTPAYKDLSTTTVEVQLTEDGSVSGTLEISSIGTAIDGKLDWLFLLDDKKAKAYQEENVFGNIDKAKVNTHAYTFDTLGLTFTEHYDFSAKEVAEKLGSYLTLPVSQISLPIPKLKKDKNRVWDIEIDRTKNYVAEHIIVTPANMLAVPDEDFEIDSPYGRYTYKTIQEPQKTTIVRTFSINRAIYPAAEYNDMKSFFDKIRNIENRKITFNLKS